MTTLGGVSPWVWFLVAGLAVFVGGLLIAADHARRTAHQRERRSWAALRGWRFVLSDPVLADRWRHGVIARGGAGIATNLVIGSLFTPLGRRAVRIFDHEQSGKVTSVVVAVKRRCHAAELVAEFWLPDRQLPQEPGMEMLGSVGERYAFVTVPALARPLITAEMVFVCNQLGGDIPVVWLEQDWLLAAAPAAASPTRLELLLRTLDELAEHLDAAASGEPATTGEPAPIGETAVTGAPAATGDMVATDEPDRTDEPGRAGEAAAGTGERAPKPEAGAR